MLQALTSSHAPQICQLLSEYFENQNRSIGKSYYQTDFSIMRKHVESRLAYQQSSIKYVGITDEVGELKWFVNYFDNQKKRTIEILLLVDNGLSEEEKKELVGYCINLKQVNGYEKITAEFADCDDHFALMFVQHGGKRVSSNYVLQ